MSHYFPTDGEFGHRMIFEHVKISTCAGDHMQFSIAEIAPHGVVPSHSHVNEQMGIMLSGKLKFTIADETKVMVPGDVYRIPGGVAHSVEALDEPVKILDVFYPIREEYR
jgi:quercetin dioxygenase-like cupin family protein